LVGVGYDQRGPVTCCSPRSFTRFRRSSTPSIPIPANILIDYDRTERNFLYRATSPQQPGIDLLLKLDDRTLQPLARTAPGSNPGRCGR